MKIVIETNGTLTECRVSGHTYECPTEPYFDTPLQSCDESTKARVMDALREVMAEGGELRAWVYYLERVNEVYRGRTIENIITNIKKRIEHLEGKK